MGGDRSADDHTLRPPAAAQSATEARWPPSQRRRAAGQLRDDRWPTITLEQLTLLLHALADVIPGWQGLGSEIKRWHDCFIGALHLA
jgi:hypothetical protein